MTTYNFDTGSSLDSANNEALMVIEKVEATRKNTNIPVGYIFDDAVDMFGLTYYAIKYSTDYEYRIMNPGKSNGELKDLDYINENSTEYAEFAGKLVLISDDIRVVYRRCDETQQTKTTSASKSVSKSVENNTMPQTTNPTSSVQKTETSTANVSAGKKNALDQAYSYLNVMAFSYSGLVEQLEYEGYSHEDATYAVDNCGADWKEQATKKAEEYLNTMSFSKSGLIEQLEYEGFTHEQATYGADQAY